MRGASRLLGPAEAEAALRASFPGAGEALEPCLALLEQQFLALRADPPARALPEAGLVAATTRLRAGGPVIQRDAFPVEASRAARLLARLARATMTDSRAAEDAATELVRRALPCVVADDGAGARRAVEAVGLDPEAGTALLREALKPELLRTSLPFAELVLEEASPATRCPLCAGTPAAATVEDVACCRWCGLCFRLDGAACPACGSPERLVQQPKAFVRGARLTRCAACGDVISSFRCPADPFVLSLHAILAAPLELAARLAAGGEARAGFAVF